MPGWNCKADCQGIAVSEAAADYVPRDLLLAILDDTEEHIDWIETQIELLAKVGPQNDLQGQMGGGAAGLTAARCP